MIEAAAEANDDADAQVPRDTASSPTRRSRRACASARSRNEIVHRAVRLGVQEQGRAGDARRRHRVHAVADRRCRRSRASTTTAAKPRAQASRRRAVLGARVQDPERPVRRQPDVLPRLLRRAELGRPGLRARPRARRSASAACCRCTPTSASEIKEVRAGDIAAAVGLKDVTTGDTLCDPDKHHHAREDGVPGAR